MRHGPGWYGVGSWKTRRCSGTARLDKCIGGHYFFTMCIRCLQTYIVCFGV